MTPGLEVWATSSDLVEVEDQVQLTYIVEELIQHLMRGAWGGAQVMRAILLSPGSVLLRWERQVHVYLYKVVDSFEVGQVVVLQVHTDAEEEACIASIHNLEIAKL